ncbi:MAG: metalloprotease-like protein, partial [Pseudonocardia sp.]|nr:metalloprotease-like protein [Pseudonocardia sp.]
MLAVALGVVVTGCAQVVPGRASVAGHQATADVAAPTRASGALPLSADEAAATATAALQEIWRSEFLAAFAREWTDVAVFAPVDTADSGAPAPPCVARAADLSDQAFYCPAKDAVVWDADGLLP